MRLQFIGSLLVAILFTISARADVTTVDFTSASLSGAAGDTLTFGGRLTNSGSPVYINGATVNLAAFDLSAWDLTPFITNAPLTPLADGDSVGPYDFFTLTIPLGFAAGNYDGTLLVQGGATLGDDATLGSGSFTVVVRPEGTAVPEPGSLFLLGAMLVGLGVVHRFRRRNICQ